MCSAMPKKVGLHHMEQWLGNKNAITPNIPFLLLFTPSLHAEYNTRWRGIFLRSVWLSCPGWVPSTPCALPTSSLVGWEVEMALMLCNGCSATAKACLYYQNCFQHSESKTQVIVKEMNFIAAKTIMLLSLATAAQHFLLSKMLNNNKAMYVTYVLHHICITNGSVLGSSGSILEPDVVGFDWHGDRFWSHRSHPWSPSTTKNLSLKPNTEAKFSILKLYYNICNGS